jgi:hypothetical protein
MTLPLAHFARSLGGAPPNSRRMPTAPIEGSSTTHVGLSDLETARRRGHPITSCSHKERQRRYGKVSKNFKKNQNTRFPAKSVFPAVDPNQQRAVREQSVASDPNSRRISRSARNVLLYVSTHRRKQRRSWSAQQDCSRTAEEHAEHTPVREHAPQKATKKLGRAAGLFTYC